MSEYIQSVKSIVDNLAAVANPVANSDLVSTLLSGLSLEYYSFVTFVNIRVNPVLSEDLISLMLSQYIYHEHAITSPDSITFIFLSPAVHTVFRTPSYHSAPSFFRGRGCGRGREHGRGHGRYSLPSHQSTGGRPQCQICNRFGHYANQCYNRYDDSASPTALLHSYGNSPVDSNWYVDSGATHHLTADIANLAAHSEYQGPDRVRMGNGAGLPIRATDASLLCSPVSSFVLKNLLHIPNITKNLQSVSQFTADKKVLLEFHPGSYFVKDLSTRKTLLRE